MDTIYDCILKKVVPIYKATNEGIRQFLSRTCDDDPINHNLILGCIIELEKREKTLDKSSKICYNNIKR